MKTHYPMDPVTGIENPALTWQQGNPSTGTEGSYPPYQLCVNPQTELINLITAAGLTPTDADMTQVYEAILALIHANYPTSVVGATGAQGAPGVNAFEAPFMRIFGNCANEAMGYNTIHTVTGWSLQNVGAVGFQTSTFSNGVFHCGAGEGGLYFVQALVYLNAFVQELNIQLLAQPSGGGGAFTIGCSDDVDVNEFTSTIYNNINHDQSGGFVFLSPGDAIYCQVYQWTQEGNGRIIANATLQITRIPN